jgi:hypothetical protein
MAAPGGWIILNHEIYRARDDVYREKTRQRVQRFRDKFFANNGNVTLQETLLKRNPSASVSASASESASESTRGGCKGEDDLPDDFKKFWQDYPKKVGKLHALKAWSKARRPPIEKIIQAIKEQKGSEQWRKNGGEFIPHPATWINAGRWDDVVGVEEEPACPKCQWPKSKCTCSEEPNTYE